LIPLTPYSLHQIWDRIIVPPNPLVCCTGHSEWGGPTDETGKITGAPCHSKCGTIKSLPCSKALRTENRPKFCSPSRGWLVTCICGFTSCSRIFHLYRDVTIVGEGLQNLGQCSALKAFEQVGIFIVSHLLWHGTSVFQVSTEGPPHSVTSYDTRGGVSGGSGNFQRRGAL
jgi:hypothetical protein